MPRTRTAGRHASVKRPLALPALGVASLVAAGVVLTGMTAPGPDDSADVDVTTISASAVGRPPSTLPEIADLRDGAAARAAGSVERATPTASPTPTPTPEPTASPAPTPTASPTPTPEPALTAEGFPVVEGCQASAPDLDGVENGRLSDDQLCEIGDGHRLRADAAAAFLAMEQRFREANGEGICLTDSYRDYDGQVSVAARKPGLAAPPGTSNHGWGQALDLSCGAESYDSDTHAWLVQNGPEFGWTNPPWARAGGSLPEPWHWEFDPELIG